MATEKRSYGLNLTSISGFQTLRSKPRTLPTTPTSPDEADPTDPTAAVVAAIRAGQVKLHEPSPTRRRLTEEDFLMDPDEAASAMAYHEETQPGRRRPDLMG